jgi:protein-tyrosine phosphatase
MIDLHFHCLPGIDDGPRSWDDAVALCRYAAAEGTTKIVATPHVLREGWINDDAASRNDLIRELNSRLDGTVVVLPGCEYFFSGDALELWEQGSAGPLSGLNRSRYLLVEFPALAIPREAEDILYEMRFSEAVPVIAHPERNLMFARDPDLLEQFVSLGARTQVTAASLIGEFGKNAQVAAQLFFDRGLVHTVSSDAHNIDRRPPRLKAAYEWALIHWGVEATTKIFIEHAEAIIDNRPIELEPAS